MKFRDKMRWTSYTDMLRDEYRQCELEGRKVQEYQTNVERILTAEASREREAEAGKLLLLLEQAPVSEDFPFNEPQEYEEILSGLPESAAQTFPVSPTEQKSSLKGGWYGRMCGCLLGIPVEAWTRDKIMEFLKESGQFPIKGYLTGRIKDSLRNKYEIRDTDETTPYDRIEACWIENVREIPVDDDVNYPILSLKIMERYGRGFDAEDVAESWLFSLPGFHACTAERVAYRNIMNGILPPFCGSHKNPYREWLGAQIRGDFWGYVNPGNPIEAARMAYVDASVSHSKNGIYAEMLVAAIVSLSYCRAFTMCEVVEAALLQIPHCSRVWQAVDGVIKGYKTGTAYQDIVEVVHKKYNDSDFFDWCYVIPNITLVTAILLYFGNDYSEAIAQAIYCGFDTDCNGATIGSAIGVNLGFEKIETKWYASLKPVVNSGIHGYNTLSFNELIDRTWNLLS